MRRKILSSYRFMLLMILSIGRPTHAGDMETKIINTIFNGSYNKEARPTIKETDPVKVEFEIAYTQLLDMDEKLQILKSSLWVRQKWDDHKVGWNPDDYAGVTSINVSPDLIWKPDIVLYNSVDDKGEMYKFTTKASISSNGTVKWLSPAVVTTSCPINILHFPFDSQTCILTFGSWTHDGQKLNLTFQGREAADLSSYSDSGEWELLSVEAVRNVKQYSCCNAPYYDLTYKISLRRLTLFYTFYLILPCIVLAMVVAMSFLFPQESGQRLSLVVTVMLGMTVFMLIITNNIPPTSLVVPLIGKFFTALLVEIALSLFLTGLTLELHYASPKKEIPRWVNLLIFKILGSVFSFRRYKKTYNMQCEHMEFHNTYSTALKQNGAVLNGGAHTQENVTPTIERDKEDTPIPPQNKMMESQMSSICEGVNKLCRVHETKTEDMHRKEEWQEAARILDRFFFTLVMLTVIITVLVCYSGK